MAATKGCTCIILTEKKKKSYAITTKMYVNKIQNSKSKKKKKIYSRSDKKSIRRTVE